ncbi:hypothetical protein V8D89_004244 [Ganoderma adspersum]
MSTMVVKRSSPTWNLVEHFVFTVQSSKTQPLVLRMPKKFGTPTHNVEKNYEDGASDYERKTSAQCCRSNLEAKLLYRADNPDVSTAIPLQELQTIWASQGFGTPSQRAQVAHCTIYYECRRSDSAKHIDQMLGTGVIFFPEVNTMLSLALQSRILKEVNGGWTEFYSMPLLDHPKYYDTYIVLPKQTQQKGKQNSKPYSFSVELYINVGQYAAHTEDPKIVNSRRVGTKCKTSTVLHVEVRAGSMSAKRIRETTSSQPVRQILRLMFVADGNLLAHTPSAISVIDIRFKKTTCLISEGSDSATLVEESPLLSGFLETRSLDLSAGECGSTKDVFGL